MSADSHPIPARGETTPDCEYDAPCLTGSCTESLPCLTEWHSAPAASLPVEPAGPFDTTHCDDGCARHDSLDPSTVLWKAILHSPTCQQRQHIARLTSEVSALREAVDRADAVLQRLASQTRFATYHEDAETRMRAEFAQQELTALRAARRDGAP